ncbi:MAG TPA: hypothetical protein VN030_04750 [Cellvibrio sp.]|nr:hypothetical protein [Cellvibrio sp.]
MTIELTRVENIQTFDVAMKDSQLSGAINNTSGDGACKYKTDKFEGFLSASDPRADADELGRLNKTYRSGGHHE